MIAAPSSLTSRDRAIVRVFGITLGLNVAVAATKIAVGVATARLAVLGDGLHGILDGANNVLGIAAIVIAAKPPDREHPYGHRKFENIAAMAIGGLIVLVAWELLDNILRSAWTALRSGDPASAVGPLGEMAKADATTVGLLIGAVAVNLAISSWQRRQGVALESTLLTADASHTRADASVTLLGIASLLFARFRWWVDPLLALIVLIFLLRAAWGIIRENLPVFTDQATLDPVEVKAIAMAVDGVSAAGEIRSHGPSRDIHLDLAITIAGELSAAEAEGLENEVRTALCDRYPGVTMIAIRHHTEDA
jgi:cation diffusion facilitator family transporter